MVTIVMLIAWLVAGMATARAYFVYGGRWDKEWYGTEKAIVRARSQKQAGFEFHELGNNYVALSAVALVWPVVAAALLFVAPALVVSSVPSKEQRAEDAEVKRLQVEANNRTALEAAEKALQEFDQQMKQRQHAPLMVEKALSGEVQDAPRPSHHEREDWRWE